VQRLYRLFNFNGKPTQIFMQPAEHIALRKSRDCRRFGRNRRSFATAAL